MIFKVDYCNGFVERIEADSLISAMEEVDKGTCYTQCNERIYDESGVLLAERTWFGCVPSEEEMEDWETPLFDEIYIGGGFYDGWRDSNGLYVKEELEEEA